MLVVMGTFLPIRLGGGSVLYFVMLRFFVLGGATGEEAIGGGATGGGAIGGGATGGGAIGGGASGRG